MLKYLRRTYRPCTAGPAPNRRIRLQLERLEERRLLAAGWLGFSAETGLLSISDPDGSVAVAVATTNRGFVQVVLDGVTHSSNPAAPAYDSALAGASAATLHGVTFIGSAQAPLVLDALRSSGSLYVVSDTALTVAGPVRAGSVALTAAGLLNLPARGSITARQIQLNADTLTVEGAVSADGGSGGSVSLQAGAIIQSGRVTADGHAGPGGQIDVQFDRNYIGAAAALLQANGSTTGGTVTLDGDPSAQLFTSGTERVTGTRGGTIELFAQAVIVDAGTVNASGRAAGGTVIVGGRPSGLSGSTPAETVTITAAAALHADATQRGNGGDVSVWSTQATDMAGTVTARGGARAGSGGTIEVSSAGTLQDSGQANAGAAHGQAGQVLLDPNNLTISASTGTFPQYALLNPGTSTGFGRIVVALTNGNLVVTNPTDSTVASDAGAVYLFNGQSGALISTLTGSHANDLVGQFSITALNNGNFVVDSPSWNGDIGAVTWASGTTGVNGTVAATNSLVGSSAGDDVGEFSVTALTNGNYVVASPDWNNTEGAATWGSGSSGISGIIASTNSLVGSTSGDNVGHNVTALTNGNYVVDSTTWNNNLGAVTWGNGTTGIVGVVSSQNSLVGSTSGDSVGSDGLTALTNGNYVVASPAWNDDVGAVTWGNGSTGTSGSVAAGNSIIGTTGGGPIAGDRVGGQGVTALTNGDYVVLSPFWNGDVGAATWADGTAATSAVVGTGNSITGTNSGDEVSEGGITALTNGNYVVSSPFWNNDVGAATWGDGTAATNAVVGSGNSLTGAAADDEVSIDGVAALTNGNYVVESSPWNNSTGAVTWGDGAHGTSGVIASANSITGAAADDQVGAGVTVLTNGNYVVDSPFWNNNVGAVTWAAGTAATSAVVGTGNSITGATSGDMVGDGGVIALTNGNYVVGSPDWNNEEGAMTWGNGSAATSAVVATGNSITGTTSGDQVANGGIHALSNGNYVVRSFAWNNSEGAATWGNGTNGKSLDGSGTITALNSLLGAAANSTLTVIAEDAGAGTFFATFVPSAAAGAVVIGLADPPSVPATFAAGQDIGVAPGTLVPTLAGGAAVSLAASNDLTVSDPISVSAGGHGGDLTLTAGDSLALNAAIDTDGGSLNLGGAVSPGGTNPAADALTAGQVVFQSASTYSVQLNGTTAGSGYDQLQITGPVDLSQAQLAPTSVGGFANGQTFVILTSTQAIDTTFAGLKEGDTITVDNQTMKISYQNDQVTLTVMVNEPPVVLSVMNTSNDATVPNSLPWAVAQANADTTSQPYIIDFSSSVFSTAMTIKLARSLELNRGSAAVTINGPAAGVTLAGGGPHSDFSVILVDLGTTVFLDGLTVTKGHAGMGGGIDNNGTLTVIACTITGNSASTKPGSAAYGGGIDNAGTLTISNSTITRNKVTGKPTIGGGGGINNAAGGTMTVSGCTIAGNSTVTGSGAATTPTGGGGIDNSGTLTVSNSTITANKVIGVANASGGGGIATSGMLIVSYSTIAGNKAVTHGANGGGIADFETGTLTLLSTVIAGNTASVDPDVAIIGATTPSDHNLIGNGTGLGSSGIADGQNGNIVDHPALLAKLGSYGGPTQTLALLPGSPALGHGGALTTVTQAASTSATTLSVANVAAIASTPGQYFIEIDGEEMTVTAVDLVHNTITVTRGVNGQSAAPQANDPVYLFSDQRGIARPAAPDIGAFQSGGFAVTIVAGASPQSATVGRRFALPLAVTVTALDTGEPIQGGIVTFTVQTGSNGQGASVSHTTVKLNKRGQAKVIATANLDVGSYTVTAVVSPTGSAVFDLTNTSD